MDVQQFIRKWEHATLSERSAAQQHFLDLCELLGQPKPAEADPDGSEYTFERGVTKNTGDHGWADVWKRGFFGWEYKGRHKDLTAAYRQLLLYREDLENPPLLVVCDLHRFEIHTNFVNTAKHTYRFDTPGLAEPKNLETLRRVFTDPDSLKPGQTTASVTEEAAERFARLADSVASRGHEPHAAAHFLMKLMFCMFAEDIELLPAKLFSRVVTQGKHKPDQLAARLADLFQQMAKGGYFGPDEIHWFNGGLFDDSAVIELTFHEIDALAQAADRDWASVEPSIFGTLFERSLDPAKRSQIGAHYTSRADIETLLEPVVMAPLRREWAAVKEKCEVQWPKVLAAGKGKAMTAGKETKTRRDFDRLLHDFAERLAHVTVLDPACGSGNFLYVAIRLLLDLNKEVIAYAATKQTTMIPQVRPTQLHGIEINPYAQQLAQVVIWIGYLQWMRENGFGPRFNPVLEPIDNIRRMDAILDLSDPLHPKEPEWPAADFIVGNPPFLGGNKIRAELGDDYVDRLFEQYRGRVGAAADLCCYWLERARQSVQQSGARVGLLATQGVRGGVNRDVVERIALTGAIYFAESDRNWVLDGASVHVSMIGFDNGTESSRVLDGNAVARINANLTSAADVTTARRLRKNRGLCCYGSQQKADFDITVDEARALLSAANPINRPNSDVVRRSFNGKQLLQRTQGTFVIDFADERSIDAAAGYEQPFELAKERAYDRRRDHRELRQRRYWWLHARPSPKYRSALTTLSRYLVTPNVSKHRVFLWMTPSDLVDHQAMVFVRDDDYFMGVLHSRLHEVWTRAQGTQVRERESGFRYTHTTCFETFPFPEPTDVQRETIAAAARELDMLRNAWLNPPEWVREEVLEFPGSAGGPWACYVHEPDARGVGTVRYPRLVARDEERAAKLAKRTLTNLYNQRPTWLELAHSKLDEAVFAAYGWSAKLTDGELLTRLLELNLSATQR